MAPPVKTADEFFDEIEDVLELEAAHHMYLLLVHVDGVDHIKAGRTDKDFVKHRDWQLKNRAGHKLECSLLATFPNSIACVQSDKKRDSLVKKYFRSLETIVKANLTEIAGKHADTVFEGGTCSTETFQVSAGAALRATAKAMQVVVVVVVVVVGVGVGVGVVVTAVEQW